MIKETLEPILGRFAANKKEGLLPILQEIQKQHGYLTEEILTEVGRYLNLPANKVYGVATFYDQFRFQPRGTYHLSMCRGTACHVAGSATILEELQNQFKVKAGGVSRDRKFSLEITSCLGACDSSPVIMVNEEVYTRVTQTMLDQIIRSLKEKTK